MLCCRFFFSLQLVFHPALCPPCRWAAAPPPSPCPLLFCSRFLKPGIIAGRERPAPFANGYSNDPLGRQQFSVAADVSRCRNISISLNIEASAFSYSGEEKKRHLASFQKWLNVCERAVFLSLALSHSFSFSRSLSPFSLLSLITFWFYLTFLLLISCLLEMHYG